MSTRKKPWRRNYTSELGAVTKPPLPPLSIGALVSSAEFTLKSLQNDAAQLRVTLATLKQKIKRRQSAGVIITNLVTNAAIALTVSLVSVSFTNWHPSGTEMFVKTIVSKEHTARYRVAGKLETITRLEPVSTNVSRYVAKVAWTEVPLRATHRDLTGVPDLPPLPTGLKSGILNTNKP